MKAALREKIVEILDAAKDLAVATVREDGSPQNTTVSFVHDGLTIYFACGADSQKAINLTRDNRLSITLTAPYKSWTEIKGLSMSARARRIDAPEEVAHIGRLMQERFPEVSGIEGFDEVDLAMFEVRPEVVSVLDYALGFGHTDFAIISEGDVAELRSPDTHVWMPTEHRSGKAK